MDTIKEIFDALTGDSRDGCDPDWCHEVLENAEPRTRRRVEDLIGEHTEQETASILGIMS